jgi:hypothetical protein
MMKYASLQVESAEINSDYFYYFEEYNYLQIIFE